MAVAGLQVERKYDGHTLAGDARQAFIAGVQAVYDCLPGPERAGLRTPDAMVEPYVGAISRYVLKAKNVQWHNEATGRIVDQLCRKFGAALTERAKSGGIQREKIFDPFQEIERRILPLDGDKPSRGL